MRKIIIFVFIFISLLIGGFYFWLKDAVVPKADIEEASYKEIIEENDDIRTTNLIEDIEAVANVEGVEVVQDIETVDDNAVIKMVEDEQLLLQNEINLAVPFTPQAPFANWGLPYQEACEEASAYMVYLYYKGEPSGLVDQTRADVAIWEIVNFQTDYLGTYLDTTAFQTADVIDSFYGLTANVIENPTVDQIKTELAAGHPVIVPAAGRKLGNPFFSGEGPIYHMLVLRGYTDDDKFITNDPGTRNGEAYMYDIDVIMEAIGDWNNGDPGSGAKRVIFVAP